MEMYLTEEERVEALKRWWKENATAVFLGIGLGIAALSGWNLWEKAQNHKAEQASLLYQKLMQIPADAKQDETGIKLAEEIIKTDPDRIYARYAQLYLIHRDVENGKLEAAHKKLDSLLTTLKDPEMKTLVTIRLARVMHGEGKTADALKQLETLNAGKQQVGWNALVSELRGDLLYAQGQKDAARTAYEQARSAGDAPSPLLLQKLANMGSPLLTP